MFFVISKVLDFMYSPLSWIVLLCIIVAIIKNKKWKRKLQIILLAITLFFSNSFIVDEVIRLMEVKKATIKPHVYTVGIVLGGGMISYDTETGQSTFRHNPDRIMQALYLYKYGRIEKILISSGSGNLLHRNVLEACLLRDFLIELGFDEKDIIAECESDNTYENAKYTAQILAEQHIEGPYLLITSATHIRRARACFLKQGVNVDVFPTNPITGKRRYDIGHLLVPNVSAIQKWELVFKELIGLAVYKIFAYI